MTQAVWVQITKLKGCHCPCTSKMSRPSVHSRGHWQLGAAIVLAACIGQACCKGAILATDSSLPNPYGAPLGDGMTPYPCS
eukprot:6483965-Amphidinium_carterae.1